MDYKAKLIQYLHKNGKKKRFGKFEDFFHSGKCKKGGLYFKKFESENKLYIIDYCVDYYIMLTINLEDFASKLDSAYTPNKKYLGYYDEFNPLPDNDPDNINCLSHLSFSSDKYNDCVAKFNERTGRNLPQK